MKYILAFSLFGFIALTACNSEVQDNKNDNPTEKKKSEANKVEDIKGFQDIEILFDDDKFANAEELELLKEIKICSDDPEITTNSEIAPCSPENFKFLPLQEDISLKNGFILLIKAETGGFPLRRTLIFQRERGQLVKTNGFVGNIIGRVPSESGYDNLLMRFRDKDEADLPMFYNCLFEWKDGKYEFKQVEVIQGPNWGGPVKEQFKKETSKEIYDALMHNEMLF